MRSWERDSGAVLVLREKKSACAECYRSQSQDNSLLTMFYKQNLFQADTHLRRIKTKHSFLSGRICRKKFEVLLYEMWKEGSAILILIVRALVVVKNVLLLLRQETQYPYILRASSPFGG